jgi:microcystin-dependent protein
LEGSDCGLIEVLTRNLPGGRVGGTEGASTSRIQARALPLHTHTLQVHSVRTERDVISECPSTAVLFSSGSDEGTCVKRRYM